MSKLYRTLVAIAVLTVPGSLFALTFSNTDLTVPEGDSDFICEAPTEPPKRKRRTRPHRSSDESLP